MNLRLPLKRKYFEMTKAGIKTEDYREITPYWFARLFDCPPFYEFHFFVEDLKDLRFLEAAKYSVKHFANNTMTLGYPKSTDTERILNYEHAGIEIRTGNPEWGAEPNKLYFVIMHGKKIN